MSSCISKRVLATSAFLASVACSGIKGNPAADTTSTPHNIQAKEVHRAPDAESSPPPKDLGLPNSEDATYGIYLNGHKVGWMLNRLSVEKQEVRMRTELHASVSGLGNISSIELIEKRSYDPHSGNLRSLAFEQSAATGKVVVQGEATQGRLSLKISAGGNTTQQTVEVTDNLSSSLATYHLAREGKVGAHKTVRHFDGSILKELEVQHRVQGVETRVFGGVESRVVRIESDYPELNIKETSWLDDSGTVLESKVGGFFVARLEPPEMAKKLDYSQDLLVSAVVPTPRPARHGRQQQHGSHLRWFPRSAASQLQPTKSEQKRKPGCAEAEPRSDAQRHSPQPTRQ